MEEGESTEQAIQKKYDNTFPPFEGTNEEVIKLWKEYIRDLFHYGE